MNRLTRVLVVGGATLVLAGCFGSSGEVGIDVVDEDAVFAVANGCFVIAVDRDENFIASPVDAGGDTLTDNQSAADRFLMRASDLGKYLLYTQDGNYLVSDDGQALYSAPELVAEVREVEGELIVEDRRQSEGEWLLEAVPGERFMLQHIRSGGYITAAGALGDPDEAAKLDLIPEFGCAEFPELSVDATGAVGMTEFEDGDVFGFVETHAHLFSNRAFGGGGAFHGAPFHPLGVEHALHDCELSHGEGGRKDFIGFAFSDGLNDLVGLQGLFEDGELPEDDHITAGYPDFTDWPNAPFSSTHQMQYYKWMERAYLSGMRLLVQHVTSNQVLCELVVGLGTQPLRDSCNDMVTADRIIEDTFALERYIDAQSGGPGQGWFRVVFSPEEAREQIRAGKLAVVLGLEVSDLFDCFLVPFGDNQRCTEEDVVTRLDEYYDKGVRALFPVHKFDNDFSAGDGDRRVSDIGNFLHTGHYSNFVECPEEYLGFSGGFDTGGVNFGDLNQPRVEYDGPPHFDMSDFAEDVPGTLEDHIGLLIGGPLDGEFCQNHGITELGEFLMLEMMKRGMIIEVDHFPRKGYKRAFEILEEHDYPAAGTHGRNFNGKLYELGGVARTNFGRCSDPENPGAMGERFLDRIQLIRDNDGYPAEGFGFDLNGFAGAPGPRFGPRSNCSGQTDEGITYPFTSWAGDVTLQQPQVGNRVLDFNTEGMVHLGLVAELIEDVRRDGITDEELEPLFRSAEGYLRMWEKAEQRAQVIGEP